MLSEAERKAIEAQLAHYEFKRAACIEALKIVQKHRGWVSDESLHDLAPLLEMSVDELDNVATFYNLIFRQPVGEHVILLCDSVSCWLMGYERMRDHLQQRLGIAFGETSADGRFTLLPMVCLGDCDHAPVMMIGESLYHNLDEARVDGILARYGATADDGGGSEP
ncbi:MAG: NADH-quinone oxidoreductase subunit NuoE [Anaerolineae bacterium]|nr:NADH-quinone oxidoreductase subunit NuoE [Anaerolineae bacterium]